MPTSPRRHVLGRSRGNSGKSPVFGRRSIDVPQLRDDAPYSGSQHKTHLRMVGARACPAGSCPVLGRRSLRSAFALCHAVLGIATEIPSSDGEWFQCMSTHPSSDGGSDHWFINAAITLADASELTVAHMAGRARLRMVQARSRASPAATPSATTPRAARPAQVRRQLSSTEDLPAAAHLLPPLPDRPVPRSGRF